MSSRVDSGNRRRISATQAIPTISIFPFSRSLSIRFPFNYRIFVFILIFIRRTSNPWKGDSIRNYTKISFQSKAKNQIFFHNRVVYRCFTRTNEARKKRIIINVKKRTSSSEWMTRFHDLIALLDSSSSLFSPSFSSPSLVSRDKYLIFQASSEYTSRPKVRWNTGEIGRAISARCLWTLLFMTSLLDQLSDTAPPTRAGIARRTIYHAIHVRAEIGA